MYDLSTGLTILLILCLLAAAAFEFINGFHDTANAVATVIYTRSMKPRWAVIWSGIWNFIGVYFGGIAVAIGIINLLPLDALIDQNVYHNVAMILSLILTAVIWNLGTWYFGIPCSSSHTLLGSIFGVGIAFMFISSTGEIALNWGKVIDAGLSLLISPIFGFGLTMLLMLLFRRLIKKKKFFQEPDPKKKPPFWIRGVLILTCTSVSFSHGSNDGQKGVGLVMIILIGMLPAYFALDSSKNPTNMIGNVQVIEKYYNEIDTALLPKHELATVTEVKKDLYEMKAVLAISNTPKGIDKNQKFNIRKDILSVSRLSDKILKSEDPKIKAAWRLTKEETSHLKANIKELRTYTEFAPWWVLLLISTSLGLGTMVGWKRIVVTIGEKIGKSHLTYAQGASAEIVAASTIGFSTLLGLPVSTTHVLSSGVAGSMVSQGGLKNLQYNTVKNILIAWAVTIPVTVALSCGLFLLSRWAVNNFI
jgi:phosphate/sulfate permease